MSSFNTFKGKISLLHIMGFSYEQDIDWKSAFREWSFAFAGGLRRQFPNGIQLQAAWHHGPPWGIHLNKIVLVL